jgi:DNA (cytosine-5)-methyltransferase 1
MSTASLKLLSLFTGAGGLDLGLELAGFTTVAVNELESHACETLRANRALPTMRPKDFANWFEEQITQKCYKSISSEEALRLKERIQNSFGKHPFLRHAQIVPGDIRKISSRTLLEAAKLKRGDLTLVAGGPPCQPFSRAGKRESVDVSTGQLFREFARIVRDLRPRWFLFENVKGLVLTKTDVVRVVCKDCGSDPAVSFDERQAYFNDGLGRRKCSVCGSSRTRVQAESERGGSLDIILNEFESIGYRCAHTVLNAADFGAPQIRERLIIVGSRDGEPFTWPTRTHECPNADVKQRPLFLETRLRPWLAMSDVLWSNGHHEFGALDMRRAVLWVKNVVRPHDEPVTWGLDRPSPTIGAHQSAKLAIAPEGVPEEQLRRQQWHILGKRQGDYPPVAVKHAYLSDEELLKLQTFPSYWYLYGTRMQRAFQIGNAVPTGLAKALGIALIEASGGRYAPLETPNETSDNMVTTQSA